MLWYIIWGKKYTKLGHEKTLTVILELINYSCKQKPINDNHLGQVDESQYLMKQPKKHHHVFIWYQTLAF